MKLRNKHLFWASVLFVTSILIISLASLSMAVEEIPSDQIKSNDKKSEETISNKKEKSKGVIKYLKKKEWYKQREDEQYLEEEITTTYYDEDLSSIQKSASEEIKSIIVLIGEIPFKDKNSLFAPIFLTDQEKFFGTGTDFSFRWVGYKGTFKFKQKGFPWSSTDLTEIFIGSFLFASGTNLGFSGGTLKEEDRFYTNYTSEIITLQYKFPFYTSVGLTFDSRQYFFVERDTGESFIMPKDHINFFPRIDISYDNINEKGIDQLTQGVKLSSWAGYGIRNRWERWGEPPEYELGKKARTFVIYSVTLTAGLLYNDNHNLVLRSRYKGGVDNDFISRARFGGTIDNAKLDVVHGFTIDQFRVNRFSLINLKYGFNIFKRLRMNLFFDYAHIFSPTKEDIFGSGYGFRIIAWGGLPIWITHGVGRKYRPQKKSFEHTAMIMTAAGW